jgi:hypothetical protein
VLFSFDPESELAQGKGKLKKAAFLRSKKVLSSTARLSKGIMKYLKDQVLDGISAQISRELLILS